MAKLLKRFWDALVFVGLLIGLVYIPADLYGLPDAYPWLRTASDIFDRSDLILGFAIIAVTYIVWMDARPYFIRIGERRRAERLALLGQECLDLSRAILDANKRANSYEHHRALIQPVFWELSEMGVPFLHYDETKADAANANAAAKYLAAVGGFLKNGRLEEARHYARETVKDVAPSRLPPPDTATEKQP